MKTIKRIIVVVLAISVISSFNIITVSADSEIQESGLSVYGEESLENLTPEMQLQQLNANKNISADKKAQATEKLEFMMLTEAERTNVVQSTMARSLCAIKTCNVPFYRQEKSYWCGPATTKQTVCYLSKGANNPTQTQIAGYIKTTTAGSSSTNMANWLKTQGYYYYSVKVSTMTTRDIVNYVATGLDAYDYPCFGGVKITSSMVGTGRWRYTTGGHFLNISSIEQYEPDYNNSRLQVTDPFITWVDTSVASGKYSVSVGDYKAAMTSFWW